MSILSQQYPPPTQYSMPPNPPTMGQQQQQSQQQPYSLPPRFSSSSVGGIAGAASGNVMLRPSMSASPWMIQKLDYYKCPNATELKQGDTAGLPATYDAYHVRTFEGDAGQMEPTTNTANAAAGHHHGNHQTRGIDNSRRDGHHRNDNHRQRRCRDSHETKIGDSHHQRGRGGGEGGAERHRHRSSISEGGSASGSDRASSRDTRHSSYSAEPRTGGRGRGFSHHPQRHGERGGRDNHHHRRSPHGGGAHVSARAVDPSGEEYLGRERRAGRGGAGGGKHALSYGSRSVSADSAIEKHHIVREIRIHHFHCPYSRHNHGTEEVYDKRDRLIGYRGVNDDYDCGSSSESTQDTEYLIRASSPRRPKNNKRHSPPPRQSRKQQQQQQRRRSHH